MEFKKLEDIVCWQKARNMCKSIFKLTKNEAFKTDFRHVSQINGSAGSSMDNIAEGYGRQGNKEFIQFLYISTGSTLEVKSQSYRALDKDYISMQEFDEIIRQIDDTYLSTLGLIRYLKNSGMRGSKYK